MFLEQLILASGAAEKAVNIKECAEGIDFFFKNKSHANWLVDFVQSKILSWFITSKQLISQDFKSNVVYYKYSTSLEIAPICWDDLILLPKPLQNKLGGIGPLVLCYKISNAIHLVDCITMET